MKLREISLNDYNLQASLIESDSLITHGCNPSLPGIIEKSFGFRARFFEVKKDEQTIALIAGNQIGKKFVSLPHFSYGNIRINKDFYSLNEEIFQLMQKEVGFTEFRDVIAYSENVYSEKNVSWLRLDCDPTLQWNQFKQDLTRKIKKAQLSDLEIVVFEQNHPKIRRNKLLEDFFLVYRKNMKRLGSPHLPLQFFNHLFDEYQFGIIYGVVLYHDGLPVGGAINTSYDDFVENNWFATDWDYNSRYTSYLLNWVLIQEALRHKFLLYSFGRSTIGSGVHKYKKQWGAFDVPLQWSYPGKPGQNPRSIPNLSWLWKILPSFFTNFAGPIIAKRIY